MLERAKTANKKHRAEIRKLIDERKAVPCMDCRHSFPPCVMDFDHVRGKKLFNVSEATSRSVQEIVDEIAKCDVVCANCHRLRTHTREK